MARVGRYEIESEIGRGSMGVVYLAHDPLVRRRVALKTYALPSGFTPTQQGEFRERLMREAQAAGSLSHPAIVTIFDVGEDSAGVPFIAMEHVEGQTLRDLIVERQRLPSPRVFALGATLAEALHMAHAAGVVHRDIKPANILVRELDGAFKIADFGIARFSASDLTGWGQTLGSPAYMSPEQLRGGDLDGRSDLFGLAAVLYEAFCGEPPFAGENLAALAYAVVHESHAPISGRVAGLPRGLDEFFDRALAKNSDSRYPDGHAFRDALDAIWSETPAELVPGESVQVAPGWGDPKIGARRGLALAAVPIVVAALWLAWKVGGRDRTQSPSAPAAASPMTSAAPETPGVAPPVVRAAPGSSASNPAKPSYLLLDARSSVTSGNLRLLVDGEPVYTRRLLSASGEKRGLFSRRQQRFEARIEVPAGSHEVVAQITRSSGPKEARDSARVELRPGQSRRIAVIAGRRIGSPVSLEVD